MLTIITCASSHCTSCCD